MLTGDNGILKETNKAKESHEIGELEDLISMEITAYETARRTNSLKDGINDFKNGLVQADIINTIEDATGPAEGIIVITTKKGYIFDIYVEEEGNGIYKIVDFIQDKGIRFENRDNINNK